MGCLRLKMEPRMRKIRASTRLARRMAKMIAVSSFVSAVNSGVKLILIMKASKSEPMLISPQLSVSPTPSAVVYCTASSKDTKMIGKRKNPMMLLATHSQVLLAIVVT